MAWNKKHGPIDTTHQDPHVTKKRNTQDHSSSLPSPPRSRSHLQRNIAPRELEKVVECDLANNHLNCWGDREVEEASRGRDLQGVFDGVASVRGRVGGESNHPLHSAKSVKDAALLLLDAHSREGKAPIQLSRRTRPQPKERHDRLLHGKRVAPDR